jgi:hypothetical protein
MTDYTVRDIVDFSAAGQPLGVADAFNDIMKQKVNDRIADFEAAIRPGMFSTEPELDADDLDLDDVELDDLDLEDGDWEDAGEDEDEDLNFDDEDLDLDDEDFTDEDA